MLCLWPIKMMVLDFVVTEPTGVPFLARITLQFDISLIVLTAQENFLTFLCINVFHFTERRLGLPPGRICWYQILSRQIV